MVVGLFFECVLAWISGRSWEAGNLKNSNTPKEKQGFLQNRRCRKSSEISWILASFSEVKTSKNHKETELISMFFLNVDIKVFFFQIFTILA